MSKKTIGIGFATIIAAANAFPSIFDNQTTLSWLRAIAFMIAVGFMYD